MALESNTGLGVFNNYGTRDVEGKFGAEIGSSPLKTVVYDIDHTDLDSTTPDTYSALDYVFPVGSVFVSAQIVVETAVVGPTAINVGTYTFNASTKAVTAHDLDGLVATVAVTALDAVGDRVVGGGALVLTGTGAAFAVAAPVVVRIDPTVAAATAGKFRVYVTYYHPQP